MASGEAEAVPDPPKSKTVVLKVFIHCPGCKKKVQKIVKRINGVSTCEVDPLHNKVTVTGNVDADSLIKKLLKSGKQADLWPEPKKQQHPTTTTTAPQNPNPTQKKEPDTPKETSEKSDKNKNPSDTPKEIADSTKAAKEPPKPTNDEPKKSAKDEDPKPNKSKTESSSSEEPSGGSEKEKKPQNAKSADKREADSVPAAPDVLMHQMYPPPAVVSYNTVQPTTSHAYYTSAPMLHTSQGYAAAPMPHMSQAYAPSPMPHTSQGYAAAPYYPAPQLPSEYLYYGPPGSSLSSPPEDQYEYAVFNDENANSCNVM